MLLYLIVLSILLIEAKVASVAAGIRLSLQSKASSGNRTSGRSIFSLPVAKKLAEAVPTESVHRSGNQQTLKEKITIKIHKHRLDNLPVFLHRKS